MRYDVIAIVASMRGLAQLRELVSQLPPHFGAPILCLAGAGPRIVEDLAAITPLRVKFAEQGERPQPGCVYVSPPGTSIVMLRDRTIALAPYGPESTAQRPVDTFLTSVGRVHESRALALVLAAFPDDGAEGAHSLKWRGGTVLVLDRATSEFYGMAEAIVRSGAYDRILTAGEVANALRASFTGRDLLEHAELQFELGALLDSALRIAGTHMGNIQITEPVAERLHIVAYRGLGREYLESFSVVSREAASACARALRLRRRVVVENVFEDDGYAPFHGLAHATGFSALQSTPIRDNGDVSGVFSTLYPYPHTVSRHEAQTLDEIAEAARSLIVQIR